MIKGKLRNKGKVDYIVKENGNKEVINTKIFQRFYSNDIVFLAIVAAVLILTCSVMPIVAELTKVLFGIAQLVTAFQMSLFATIGLMKVRKVFSLTLILTFMAIIMFIMSPVMGISNIIVALVIELIIIIIFRNYQKNIACFVAGALVPPFSLITPVVWNLITAPEISLATLSNVYIVLGMTLAVISLGLIGSFIGVLIGKELDKAGILRKGKK